MTPDDEVGGSSIKASMANHRGLMLREESGDSHVFPGTPGFLENVLLMPLSFSRRLKIGDESF